MEKRRVAVRTLVETVMLSGSISPTASSARLLDGIRGHQALQSIAADGARNEVSVSGAVSSEHIDLTVYGRIDRLYGDERVEEIKTTYLESERLRGGDPQHWAQAKCYAYLYCALAGLAQIDVSLTYFHLDTGEITTFTQPFPKDALEEFYRLITGRYLDLLETEYAHERALRTDVSAMPFPYPSFREGQHELAAQVYYAIREKSALLAQAPTGTGKTMAVLFPALKALADGHASKIFYLTARTTQQEAAINAARLIRAPHLRTVVISAKEKMCVYDKPICREEDCPRASGYYDRLGEALSQMNRTDTLFTPDVIRAYAARHFLCPFELSLDVSTTCDLIVCDYNYAFDPRVRLQRFFVTGRNGFVLLVDEAHNLPDRARSMYSASISLANIVETRRSVPKPQRKGSLYRALKRLEAAVAARFAELSVPLALDEPPESLIRPIESALDQLSAEIVPADRALARQLTFDLSAFRFILDLYDARYRTLYEGGKTTRTVTLFCTDASGKLGEVYQKCRSEILFSATLSPAAFYRDLSGVGEKAPFLALPSPFPPEHLAVFHLPVDLRYRAREATLALVAEAICAFVSARTRGNYLVFVPSHTYLQKLSALLVEALPQIELFEQSPKMDDAARAAFLARFSPDSESVAVGLAVMGGVFAEGIDLPAERLCGAVVVGVGLPQVCLERDVLREAYEETYQSGFRYAYQFPGASKVLQAAGRIIRTETDRGALLLLDTRYSLADYRALLPAHWTVRRVGSSSELENELKQFWRE
ncbi:MAG: DEAD/DEAH box helicase family protein [Clostridiales bacterium]|nr:DEAD/DEAH box helicase family protein [Clostridiales bacterium]